MSSNATIADRGERVVPDFVGNDQWIASNLLAQHLERYGWAGTLCEGRRVLDIACGSGYGAFGMAEAGAASVLGVDIDAEAISYAESRYPHSAISYRTGSVECVTGAFDLITCFETVEHVRDPREFVAGLRRCITPTGSLLISATTVPTMDIYPFHLHDYSQGGFLALCTDGGFVIEEVRTLNFQASPAQVREAMRERFVLPRAGTILSHPLRAARNIWGACVSRGMSYENCVVLARPNCIGGGR